MNPEDLLAAVMPSDGSAETEGQALPYPSYLTKPGMQAGGFVDESASISNLAKVSTSDFNEDDKAEIELSRLIAQSHERKDRINQAKFEAQMPIIQKNLEESRTRADEVLRELEAARQSLQRPAPQLTQGKLNLGEMLAAGLGMVLGGRPDQLLGEALTGADKRNAVDFQNQLSQFNLDREQAEQLVGFLQNQLLGEQSNQRQMTELDLRAQIDAQQTAQQQGFQSGEAAKQREFSEREKAWSQLYSANSDGEVLAAANRLKALDPVNAPDQLTIDKAVSSARTRREAAALDYYKATVGRMVDAYAGVVPETVKLDLEQRIQTIARQFEVDPKLFGEIPTEAFFTRKMAEEKLDQVKNEWKDRFKWMTDKEKNDHAESLAKIRVSRERIAIARQQANTSAARLEWDKMKPTLTGEVKTWTTKLNTQELALKNIDGQLEAINTKLTAKDSKGKPKYIPFAEKQFLHQKKRDLELKREGVNAQLEEIRSHLSEIEGVSKELDGALGGSIGSTVGTGTYKTRSGATVKF